MEEGDTEEGEEVEREEEPTLALCHRGRRVGRRIRRRRSGRPEGGDPHRGRGKRGEAVEKTRWRLDLREEEE